ncbi:MAG: penicillin-binding protein [Clostridia bacterium]|nr:penicillin-binding protein [Clostridia bacterium]
MKRSVKITLVIFGILAVLMLSAFVFYLGVTGSSRLDAEKLTLDKTCTRIYDKDENQIETSLHYDTDFSLFPEYLPNAFVAIEDKNFYTHHGFDYKRIAKAAMKNIASFSFKQGASTISQQLIKNTHLSSQKTITRKLKEYKLTRILEKRYSKEEILELYLNSIYFGHSAFGIGEAARYYFDKRVEELSPAECATLAALVKSPNRYSPFRDAEKCLARRNLVLKLMREQGYLSDAEYQTAIETPLPVSPAESASNAYLARVYEELTELFPDAKSSELGKLRVYTYYDAKLQAQLEKNKPESDVCILVRDNQTHGIKALHATAGTPKRLPASTIKPLLVYAPALENNLISPLTPVLDEKTNFGGYCPDDYNGASGEYMSVRYALSHSVNIPAVKILNELGIERGVKYMSKMDMEIERDDYSLALALGGMKEGFTLPQLADGYATFANGGEFSQSTTIARIDDEKGKTVYRFTPHGKRVFSEDVSFLMNDMLQTTAREGTAKKLRGLSFPVCAKTGTAESAGKNTDAYTISYTKNETVAVWLGNRDNSPVEATGGGLPANIALRVYEYLYANGAPEPFPETCEGVERASYDKEEYTANHRILLADPAAPPLVCGTELFRTQALPKETSTRFSCPNIANPQISVKNGTVQIVLCQTQYYDYLIKRENRGKITTVYNGKYQQTICDNSVRSGEKYTYTVIPLYKGKEGTPVTLPPVQIEANTELPDNWWE